MRQKNMDTFGKKIGLVYLSLTGNTKTISEKIGREFSVNGYRVSFYDMMDGENRIKHPLGIDPSFLAQNDMIGFGCFSAEYQPMFFFRGMLSKMRGLEGKSCFVYCTHGAEFGSTLRMMRNALRKSGAVFLGGDAFACSDEVKALLLNRIYLHHDKPGEAEFLHARQLAGRMIQNEKKRRAGVLLTRSESALPKGRLVLSLLGSLVFKQKLVKYLTRFTIDEKRCIRCGWCLSICPSLSLSFRPGSHTPIQDTNCQGCGICFECKQKAVQPVSHTLTVKVALRWARAFYKTYPRKTLDDRELALLMEDRFTIMKSRPELMSLRR
jgi:Pyruvate/2-oxoacid:ferredoxin oxidoreductase delta subunit